MKIHVKNLVLIGAILFGAVASHAADAKEEVTAAAKKLAEQPNYSWVTEVKVPEGSPFKPGPTNGKADKDGTVYVTMMMRDNLTEAVLKGEKGAITNQDGDWESLAELENAEGPGRFRAMMLKNLKVPAKQAAELADAAKELKKEGDAYVGEMTPEGAKQFLRFGRGGNGPEVKNSSGSVKFWVKDGLLSKYEFKVKGTVSFNGEDREMDRSTTTEITKVGETKLVIPEAAKKKLS
jgi:hypothetical protein